MGKVPTTKRDLARTASFSLGHDGQVVQILLGKKVERFILQLRGQVLPYSLFIKIHFVKKSRFNIVKRLSKDVCLELSISQTQ